MKRKGKGREEGEGQKNGAEEGLERGRRGKERKKGKRTEGRRGWKDGRASAPRCALPSDGEVRMCVVYEFCCLGDTLGVDGDADAVMTAGIRKNRYKLRSLVLFFTDKISL